MRAHAETDTGISVGIAGYSENADDLLEVVERMEIGDDDRTRSLTDRRRP